MTDVTVGPNVELSDIMQIGKNSQGGDGEGSTHKSTKNLQGFLSLFVSAQFVGILIIMLIFYWSLMYGEGFDFSFPAQFNWHPLLMTLGIIYLTGNGLLTFRLLRKFPKKTIKIVHASFNGASLFFVLLAILAAYVFHSNANFPHFYTMHAWIGIVTTFLLLVQGSLGFSAYLFPGFKQTLRETLLPYHIYFGHVIFLLGVVASISGLNERAIFKLGVNLYGTLPASGILINFTGILIVIFAMLIVFLSTNSYYKRNPRQEDRDSVNGITS